MNTTTIICTCWIICSVIIVIYRHRHMSTLEKFESKWKQLLLDAVLVLFAPIMFIILITDFVRKCYFQIRYKNRPRPVPKKMRRFLKKDVVLNEKNETVGVAEYNYKHGTFFTLDDIYGKGYVDSLSDKEKAEIRQEEDYGILKIQEELPDSEYKEAAITLGKAVLYGDFDKLEKILSDTASVILYGSDRHISGKKDTLNYWEEWRGKYVGTKKVTNIEVKYSNYNSRACLLINNNTIIMFMMNKGLIQKMMLSGKSLSPTIGFHDDLLGFQIDNDYVRKHLTPVPEEYVSGDNEKLKNRIPCLDCGLDSENLEWHGFHIRAGNLGWSGLVSFCPHCHKMVEFEPIIRERYGEQAMPDEEPDEKRQTTTHQFSFHPDFMGIRNYYCSESLKGLKYFDGLPAEARACAETFDFIALNSMEQSIYEQVKDCYRAAVKDGFYDAENNLGILAANFDGNEEESRHLIADAAEHGSKDAMINVFSILWCDNKYSEAIGKLFDFSVKADTLKFKDNASLRCVYNLAYLYYMGHGLEGNNLERNEAMCKECLSHIIKCEGRPEHADEKDVFEKAKNFMQLLEKSNLFCEKGFQFHSHLRTQIAVKEDKYHTKNKGSVFKILSNIELDDEWKLGLKLADSHTKDIGDESCFFLYNDKGEKERELLKHLYVEPNDIGAWELYLLMTAPTVMPTFWHGGYIERKFIFSTTDIYTIEALNSYELSNIEHNPILLPSVTINRDWSDDTTRENVLAYDADPTVDKWKADIYCCYWNEWKGLVREHIRITLRGAKVENYENMGEFIIYPYHCGIYF